MSSFYYNVFVPILHTSLSFQQLKLQTAMRKTKPNRPENEERVPENNMDQVQNFYTVIFLIINLSLGLFKTENHRVILDDILYSKITEAA